MKNLPASLFTVFLHSQKTTGTSRAAVHGNDSVAQLVEQYTFNVWVLGSSPSGITENAYNALYYNWLQGFFFVWSNMGKTHPGPIPPTHCK
jgi:hypothetical protein